MGMKGKVLALTAGAAIVASVAVTAASGARQADPGITATTIKIGGTFPLTGPASLYKTIPAAEKAYFDYVNDHGGVNGRKINFEILDDSYDPSKTVPLTQQLVEQDKVFAVYGSLGTAPGLSTWGYLNANKVPPDQIDAAWHGDVERWLNALRRVAAAYLAGEAPVQPASDACRHCHLTVLCRRVELAAAEVVEEVDGD